MTVVLWIAAVLIAVGAAIALVVVGALASSLQVAGRLASGGASARGRWGVIGFELDQAEDRLVVRFLGLRIARSTLRRGANRVADGDAAAGAEAASKRVAGKRGARARARLPIAAYRRLAGVGGRELRRSARHLHVDRLRLEAVVASDDPAWTGRVYGLGCAAVAAIRDRWPGADVHLAADFVGTEPHGAGELALRVRPVRLVPGVVRVGWAYWRERRRSHRRA